MEIETRYKKEENKIYKITTVKKKVYKKAIERKKTWRKFGDAKTMGNEGITIIGDTVYMEFLDKKPDIKNNFKINKNVKKYKAIENSDNNNKIITPKKGKRTLADIEQLFKHKKEKRVYTNDPRKIIIFNLDNNLEEEDIRYEFEKFGKIRFFKRLPNKHIAFITYFNEEDALYAIESMDGKPLGFTILQVKKASKKN